LFCHDFEIAMTS